ncbi:MAG: hypothetical protein Q8R48_06845, partial [Candidatus Omnitrophota bacterium]|nr:hypothetical protein [Candidatus Omnitrophota bacterium]
TFDASKYTNLSFYIKGLAGGEHFNIYLKDNTGHSEYASITDYLAVTTDWKKATIPLADFAAKGLDLRFLQEMQFVFEWADMSGTIYVDELAFSIDEPRMSNHSPVEIEAEDMGNLGHAITYNDPSAWASAYISSATSGAESSFDFDAPIEADYIFYIRMSQASDAADSLWVKFDSGSPIVAGGLSGSDAAWAWINYKDGNPSTKVQAHLTQGPHTISVITSEPNVKIDSIILTDNVLYAPPAIPPGIASWQAITSNGFGENNFSSEMKVYKDSLYVSTTDRTYKPSVFKINPNNTYTKLKDLSTLGIDRLYHAFGMESLGNKGLFILLWRMKDYSNPLDQEKMYLVNTLDGLSYTIKEIGSGMSQWVGHMTSGKDTTSGLAQLYTGIKGTTAIQLKRSPDPMSAAPWQGITGPLYPDQQWLYDLSISSSCIFKGALYVASESSSYRGDQPLIYTTRDGVKYEAISTTPGYLATYQSQITSMGVFGGYLYIGVYKVGSSNPSLGIYNDHKCIIYRTKDGIVWEEAMNNNFGYGAAYKHNYIIKNIKPFKGKLYVDAYGWTMSYTPAYQGVKLYSSLDGTTWSPISNPGITNTNNYWVDSIEPYQGNLYISTCNFVNGTQVIKGNIQ